MTESPTPVRRPCIQGSYCHGCTSACVELSRCLDCGAPKNLRCRDNCITNVATIP